MRIYPDGPVTAADVRVVIPTWRRPAKLARCLASIERQTYTRIIVEVVEDTRREFAIGVWNRTAPKVTEGAFCYICDDVELEPDCIEVAAYTLLSHWPDTDGVVGLHQVGLPGASESAMGLIGARFLDRFPGRRPFCPDYRRFHFDAELGECARALGRFHFEAAARLTHYHPAHYRSEMDETHRIVRQGPAARIDRAIWHERRSRGLVWGITEELVARQ